MTSTSPTLPPIQPINIGQSARTTSLPPYLSAIEVDRVGVSTSNTSVPPSLRSSTVDSATIQTEMPPADNQQSIDPVPRVAEGQAINTEVQVNSSGENDDDDDDDHSSEHDSEHSYDHQGDPYPWQAINEDLSIPCADEIAFIESKEERSAVDHAYWEQKTFFELDGSEHEPVAAGRIDWLITGFNGTQQKPNSQLVMRSPCVEIGGYLWQIKLYPKGNNTDFLSVYIECVTMQTPGFAKTCDFEYLPLPRAKGTPPLKKQVSVAAQVAVIMYNPAEPRVHEYKADAHQFYEHAADFGWKYFTREPRQVFHRRKHGQRQAILKDDSLAFSAHIRIINDLTGCLWQSPVHNGPEVSIATTGIRPLDGMSAQVATTVMLLHLRPFRIWLESYKHNSPDITLLQVMLSRALHRRLKKKHLKHFGIPEGCDIIAVLDGLRAMLQKHDMDSPEAGLVRMLTGLTSDKQLIAHQRLPTRYSTSIEQAVLKSETTATPPILLIELERQSFNAKQRKWEKIKNAVDIDDGFWLGKHLYRLYGVVTHRGALGSGQYIPFVRPAGPAKLWYMYDSYQVKCMGDATAHSMFRGNDRSAPTTRHFSEHTQASSRQQEYGIAYLAWYIREDYVSWFDSDAEEQDPVREQASRNSAHHHDVGNARQPQAPVKWTVKDNPLPDFSPLSAMRSTLTNNTNNPNNPNPLDDPIDHGDVIMSDTEEDYAQQVLLARALHGNASKISSTPPRPENKQTTKKLFSFFSGEYYSGDVLDDNTYHGHGWLIRTNGDEYKGSFRNGLPHGEGTMVYSKSGDRYTGQWLDGQHHGQGKLTEKQTGNVYEGGWKDGRRHGAFVLRGMVTEDDKHYCQICYENTINIAFSDCGHALACKQCAKAVSSCPVCRKPVIARLELFGVKVSMQ